MELDLVVVAVKVPLHFELVRAALEPGRMVYSEWPLGRNLSEAEAMADPGDKEGATHRCGPASPRRARVSLSARPGGSGYLGEVLSTTVVASGMNWGATFRPGGEYMLDRDSGATLLSVPFGHTVDVLTTVLGEFSELTATIASRRTQARR